MRTPHFGCGRHATLNFGCGFLLLSFEFTTTYSEKGAASSKGEQ
jgi:hypothetical protein